MTVARSVPTGNKAACCALNALRVYVTSIQAKALRSSVRLLGQGPHTGPYLLRTMSSNTSAFFAGASQVEHTKSDYKIDVWSRNGSKFSPAARIGELAALISSSVLHLRQTARQKLTWPDPIPNCYTFSEHDPWSALRCASGVHLTCFRVNLVCTAFSVHSFASAVYLSSFKS